MNKVIIIGGGAAGLMSAVAAISNNSEVTIYEGNEKLGKKMYITGKGRCNLTNACDISEYFDNIVSNDKFLYSALYSFTNDDVIKFFEYNGCPIKIERGNRAFPVSDKSSDIIKTLEKYLRRNGVKIVLNTRVESVITKEEKVSGVKLDAGNVDRCDRLIIATGGKSYQATGSTGDGYRFAKELGINVTPLRPSLVPLEAKEDYIRRLQGLSLRNVELTIYNNKKTVYKDFGEMLFTHFGVSGPLVLSAGSRIGELLEDGSNLNAAIDLKPALSYKKLEDRIIREIDANKNKEIKYLLSSLLPAKMVDVFIDLLNINKHLKLNEFTKNNRTDLINLLKAFPFTITGLRGFNEAIITQGGIDVSEINPSTMESKKIKGLYFAGEVIDIDALTGGYNLQLAFSTGHLAGESASI
ncbi:MAG: NAD(P)/FAD-dependent oxidoreductase [Lachnospiraceae bacterium]|nr:NAD(P)/FAD-dependent oxidoreductase [Lachnospiraceae bacterium]